jgi:putative sterol carrier protein
MPYPFLSDEWLEAARHIRSQFEGKAPTIPHVVRMNLVVTGVPFGDRDIDAHIDTSDGELAIETGHLDAADLKVTADYDTAKAILIEGNPQVGVQAFMAGKVRVEGDMSKLMALLTSPAGEDANAAAFAERIKEITE